MSGLKLDPDTMAFLAAREAMVRCYGSAVINRLKDRFKDKQEDRAVHKVWGTLHLTTAAQVDQSHQRIRMLMETGHSVDRAAEYLFGLPVNEMP